jgi:hypothetical protein
MGDIIDSINETTPLTDKDHDGLSKEIREHSREVLTSYLSGNEEVLG